LEIGECGSGVAEGMDPAGLFDAVLLPRSSHVTGNVSCHEMSYEGDNLWLVNTQFSCLATTEPGYHFVPQWKPRFISNCYEPGDRCHLNGVAFASGRPQFVTALAESDTAGGWREDRANSGIVIDVSSNEIICRGLAMPHSPRVHNGKLWVLDSGRGQLITVDATDGTKEIVTTFPGYVRGMAIHGSLAFVGLSRIRETSVFGDLPISSSKAELKCGVGIVDLQSGRQLASFQFEDTVEEIFAVEVVPNVRNIAIRGVPSSDDSNREVWLVPPPTSGPKTVI
jgi:uncharacterized protein (TIGR03032 family)